MALDLDYYRKINNSFGVSSIQQYKINDVKNSLIKDFEKNIAYKVVGINDVSVGALIMEASFGEITSANSGLVKNIIPKPDNQINIGDIVGWENDNWICTKIRIIEDSYYVGVIQKSNNTLLFYPTNPNENQLLWGNEPISAPCIISKGNIGLDIDKYISFPADEYMITCSNNTSTLNISENTRFILSNSAYKILGIDDVSALGLLNIRVKQDQVTEDDNLIESVANWYSHQHVYTVTIQNSDSTKYVNDTLTLNVIATDNSTQVFSPTLSYQSSNISAATVTNGVVTCLSEGTATITVNYNGVSDSISLTVQVAEIIPNYTVSITGATTVKLNNNITLTSSLFNNGVVDLTKSVVWNVSNQDGSGNGYVTIISQDGSNITLKAVNNTAYVNKYIVIRASKSDDNLVYDEHIVQIKSLF